MEKALNEFVVQYLRRFDSLAWRWVDMNECQAELLLRPKANDGSHWAVPVVGDDHGGFGGVLMISDGDTPLFLDTLFEYLWEKARVDG